MDFFDTHTHLTENDTDFTAYIKKANDANVKFIMIASSDYAESLQSANCSETDENVFFAAGIHPGAADENRIYDLEKFRELKKFSRFAAIGEIGLDFYYGSDTKTLQAKIFRDFLALALEMNLPSIIHCRDKEDSDEAYILMHSILEDYASSGGKFVLHAFAGTPAQADDFLELGAFFGAGGMLTFKRAQNIRETVSHLPLERIFLETDSPYLAPVPLRGKTNHPCNIPIIAEYLASLKGVSLEETARVTTANARSFFRI